MKTSKLFFLLIVIGVLLNGCADDDPVIDRHELLHDSFQELLTNTFEEYLEDVPDFPGGLALKVICGNESFFVTAGMDKDVTSQSRFRAASCTKTFTAAAILLLHQQGKLNINHFITDIIPGRYESYVPDDPAFSIPYKDEITIVHLLRHRAGVFDVANEIIPDTIPVSLPYIGHNYIDYVMQDNDAHTFTFDELVQVVAETGLHYFAPGTAYKYSNTGYSILGEIIERVSQQSFQDYLMEHVLSPVGLINSSLPYHGSEQGIPEPFVPGYVLYGGEVHDVTESNMSAFVAEGNLITTPEDLALFLNTLLSGRGVLSNHTVNSLMMDYLPTGGTGAGGYGCGLSYTNHLGYGHTGAHEGYLSLMAYDPVMDFTVVAYTNAWDLSNGVESLIYQLINILEDIAYESKLIATKF